jgi:CMP-N,N'-diacetyllegionaminic acid synthase
MRILALIPARSGSKRLPQKNIRLLGGRPLIVWSIEVTKGILEICDTLVSTDDEVIAEICEKAGAYVPWLRPAKLADDTASSVDVALHALDWYEAEKGKIDGLLLLQPTSPFRTGSTVRRGIALFKKHHHRTVIGVTQAHAHPMWTLKMEGDYLVPFMPKHGFGIRSQDLMPAYVINGAFYLITPNLLRECHSFVERGVVPLVIDSPREALDIDTEMDLSLAQYHLTLKQ